MSQEDKLEQDNNSEGEKVRFQVREEKMKNQRKHSENGKMLRECIGPWKPDLKGLGKHLNTSTEQEWADCRGF